MHGYTPIGNIINIEVFSPLVAEHFIIEENLVHFVIRGLCGLKTRL